MRSFLISTLSILLTRAVLLCALPASLLVYVSNICAYPDHGSPSASALPSISMTTPLTDIPTPSYPTGGDGSRVIELSISEVAAISVVTSNGILLDGLAATTPDGSFSVSIDRGTQVQVSNEYRQDPVDLNKVGDTIPWKIEVTTPAASAVPPYPEGWLPVSPNYDINGVTNGYVTGVKLDRPSKLVFKYNDTLLPDIVDDLAAFYYNYETGWMQLPPNAGFIAEGPEVAAEVDHFSLFVVLAKPGAARAPANIVIQKLAVDPQRILIGQSSDVRVSAINKGGLPGNYEVVVKLNGKIQKSQSVNLDPGQSAEVALILMPVSSGIYTVTAGPLGGKLVVDPRIVPDVSETDYWWLLCIAAGISTLLFSLIRPG